MRVESLNDDLTESIDSSKRIQKIKKARQYFKRALSRFFKINYFGEFDPGSGRTLAACLTHASRTENLFR